MDEALRRAERSADWEGRARALRRSGQEILARCWVSTAARAGLPRAREVLGSEYPLDADARALLLLLEETPPDAWGVEAPRAAEILLGDGDPRLSEPAAAWLGARALASQGDPTIRMPRRELELTVVQTGDHLSRLELLLAGPGAGLDRTLLLPHELLALVERVLSGPLSAASRLRLAALLTRLPDPSSGSLLERVLSDPDPRLAERIGIVERGRAGGSEQELPWRPDWARGVHRDDLTLSLGRGTLRPRGRSPIGIELPDVAWIGLFDLDRMKSVSDRLGHLRGDRVLTRVTEVLQDLLGDRVVRYAGDEWLVPYEGQDGPQRFEACLRAVSEDLDLRDLCGGVTLSAGVVRRSGASAKDLQRADEAQLEAKQAGRDRLVVASARA